MRREAATRELIAKGSSSVEPLLKVIASGNLEINQRAVLVLSALAGKQHHADDGGALGALRKLAGESIGSRKSMVDRAINDLEADRLKQAHNALESPRIPNRQFPIHVQSRDVLDAGLHAKDRR